MRTLHPTRQAAATALTLLALLVLPAAALASEAGTSEGRAARTPPPQQELPSQPACEPLVSFTATQTTGDARAVAITAQAIEQGVEGWSMVAWEVADDAEVTSLTLVDAEGRTETRIEGIERGHAEDVVELRFCGPASQGEAHDVAEDDQGGPAVDPSSGPDAAAGDATADGAATSEVGGAEPEDDEPANGDTTTGAAASARDTETTSPEPTEPDHPAAPAARATAAGGPTETTSTTDGATRAADTKADTDAEAEVSTTATGDTAPDVEPAGDTEVLGVQLARTGGEVGPLVAWGATGTLTGAVVLLLGRRRQDQGGRA